MVITRVSKSSNSLYQLASFSRVSTVDSGERAFRRDYCLDAFLVSLRLFCGHSHNVFMISLDKSSSRFILTAHEDVCESLEVDYRGG